MRKRIATWLLCLSVSCPGIALAAESSPGTIALHRDDEKCELQIQIDGKEAIVYRWGEDVDLPHYYPVRSPSGKLLTIEQADPFPHHRSLWFADTVEREGERQVSFYNAFYTRVDPQNAKSPFRDRIRHVKFLAEETTPTQARIKSELCWEADLGKRPIIDETCELRVVSLGKGEYFLDMRFQVKAAYGNVTFVSDQAHYAWPYVRMHPQFSVDKGGTITNSEGGVNQKETDNKPARWIDYSNTVAGVTEGLTIFSAAENEQPHDWLTRDYGTFGPRRSADKHGKPFLLKKGDVLKQHVGILVHSGDVTTGEVQQRYRRFVEGKL